MLTKMGKLSAAVVIAGGAVLLEADTAKAGEGGRPCDAHEQQAACDEANTTWVQIGQNEWLCGYYGGGCWVDEHGGVSWTVLYYHSTTPCPPVQPGESCDA